MAGIKQILIAIDQLLNTLAGGFADETLSSRAYRERWKIRPVIDFIFGDDHCAESYLSEMERMQLPPEFRK